ncbi:MAG: hypothetical protein ABSC94_31275, partial [Polyangiaceae bacterium]
GAGEAGLGAGEAGLGGLVPWGLAIRAFPTLPAAIELAGVNGSAACAVDGVTRSRANAKLELQSRRFTELRSGRCNG